MTAAMRNRNRLVFRYVRNANVSTYATPTTATAIPYASTAFNRWFRKTYRSNFDRIGESDGDRDGGTEVGWASSLMDCPDHAKKPPLPPDKFARRALPSAFTSARKSLLTAAPTAILGDSGVISGNNRGRESLR